MAGHSGPRHDGIRISHDEHNDYGCTSISVQLRVHQGWLRGYVVIRINIIPSSLMGLSISFIVKYGLVGADLFDKCMPHTLMGWNSGCLP